MSGSMWVVSYQYVTPFLVCFVDRHFPLCVPSSFSYVFLPCFLVSYIFISPAYLSLSPFLLPSFLLKKILLWVYDVPQKL